MEFFTSPAAQAAKLPFSQAVHIKVVINGQERELGPGQCDFVLRGAPHFFANAGDGPAEITVEFKPAQQPCVSSRTSRASRRIAPAGSPAAATRISC
jgi:hypothetical protein